MPGSFKMSKSILVPVLSCVLVFSFLMIFTVVFKNTEKNDKIGIFKEISALNAQTVDYNLNSQLENLRELSSYFTGHEKMSRSQITNTLKMTNGVGAYTDLFLIDTRDELYSASGIKYSVSSTDKSFKMTFSGVSNLSVPINLNEEVTSAIFSVPVYNARDKITAILCGVPAENYINHLPNEVYSYEDAAQIIIDASGNYISGTDREFLGFSSNFNLFRNSDITYCDESDLLETLALNAKEGVLTAVYRDNTYYICYNKLSNSDWYIASVVPVSYIYSAAASSYSGFILVLWAAFVIVSVVLFIFIRGSYTFSEKVKSLREENDKLLYVDVLTGFDSYRRFLEKAQRILRKEKGNTTYAMISMNVNNFSLVNDLLGYEDGNNILTRISHILYHNIKDSELFCRINADKYLMLIKFEADNDIVDRVKNIINDVYYQITELRLLTMFGIYKIDNPLESIYTIIDRATLARRSAKTKNDSSFAFFDSLMHLKIREEKVIENIMEEALDSKEFIVYLQPKFDLKEPHDIIGAEALVRWRRDGKMIPPSNFIALFEKNGFITKLDDYVFEEVCKQQKIWMARGYDMKVISVNISRVNINQPNFVQNLYNTCQRYNVPTQYFEIEITESVAFENLSVLVEVMKELKQYGFHISIDDFGSGYSSLNMLKDLTVDVLKIDRAFLTDSDKNKRACDIIGHVIALAVSLNMRTICEGIETRDQVDLLVNLGCDMAQGFYFARPMPIPDYEELLYGKTKQRII